MTAPFPLTDHELLILMYKTLTDLKELIEKRDRDFSEYKADTARVLADLRAETDGLKLFRAKLLGMSLSLSVLISLLIKFFLR
jgi:hypothetical protein